MAQQESAPSLSREELLSRTRARIDEIDEKLLALLNERSTLSREVGRIKADDKSSIFKPQREQEILERLCSRNTGPLPESALRSIWREIMSSSRALQRPLRVAYLGPEGTFSYFAGLEFLGHSAKYRACVDLPAVFEEVNATTCDLGIVPLENSLQGTVGISFDLFLKFPVIIQAELFSRISHCLLSREESFSDIRTVYSHPQPLAQCAFWLRAHLPGAVLIPAESTAAAARKAAETPNAASIGSGSLANLIGMNVLAKRIEDAPGNWTRFVVIAREGEQNRLGSLPLHKKPLTNGYKTSILFTLPDKPGALSSVLSLFASNGINMRKLESRPLLGERWKYVFFVDVEEDLLREDFAKPVQELSELCNTFRILGSYATGPQLDRVWEPEDNID